MNYVLVYNQNIIPYTIIPSARRKTMSIVVTRRQGVCVRVPSHVSIVTVQEWVDTKKEWIARAVHKMKLVEERCSLSLDTLQYLGKIYPLVISYGKRNKIIQRDENISIEIKEPTQEYTRQYLMKWLRIQASSVFVGIFRDCWDIFLEFCRTTIPHHTLWYGKHIGSLDALNMPILRIYAMKSRYGSLRQDGRVTLSTHLIHAPRACIEFVIFHELVHIIEFNHSRRFYALLTKLCPHWKKYKQWLEEELIILQ